MIISKFMFIQFGTIPSQIIELPMREKLIIHEIIAEESERIKIQNAEIKANSMRR